MSHKPIAASLCLLFAILAVSSGGCVGITTGPTLGIFSIPVPVSPYFQHKKEQQAWIQERYDRVPIMGPITAGGPAVALDPPTDDEIMLALEKARPVEGGVPLLYEKQRRNVRILRESIADYVDPPRFVPLVGPAMLHHAHYKCTIHFTEVTYVGWPVPHTIKDEDAIEVIYIDHNHFHLVGNVDGGINSPY